MVETEAFIDPPTSPLFAYRLIDRAVYNAREDAARALLHARIGVMTNRLVHLSYCRLPEYDGSNADVFRFLLKQKLVIDVTHLVPMGNELGDADVEKALEAWGFRAGVQGVRPHIELRTRWWNVVYRAYVVTFREPVC